MLLLKEFLLSLVVLLLVIRDVVAGRRGYDGNESYTRLGRIPLFSDGQPWGLRRQPPSKSGLRPRVPLDKVRSTSLTRAVSAGSTVGSTAKSTGSLSREVSSPIIPQDVWDNLTGEEFKDPEAVDRFSDQAFKLAASEDKNEWIEWTEHKGTTKLLAERDMMTALDDGEVMVYVGTAKKVGYGSELPIVKTKSILPMSAQEMAELLMDSSRVKVYNKMSVGRKDVFQWGENTKVVRNLTKPPMTKSNMVTVTMMHSRPLKEKDFPLIKGPHKEGFLVVSRAVPGIPDPEIADLPRNDILLGVNLLQDLGPNECLMTAFTHVYSPSIPKLLAAKVGVTSAINFVKDIRTLCEPVAN
ncbi:unnamed protein product [Cylindrotheca closterium]|uniref:START domain-containing protein n=1 Tax=Cylindrotheca closterium TaxID=2856 RepID=A0AAD2FLT6_9STRA|nr:unnamed protein product [Cylindrotheca closterium]